MLATIKVVGDRLPAGSRDEDDRTIGMVKGMSRFEFDAATGQYGGQPLFITVEATLNGGIVPR